LAACYNRQNWIHSQLQEWALRKVLFLVIVMLVLVDLILISGAGNNSQINHLQKLVQPGLSENLCVLLIEKLEE
jgi:hypothetical protein